MENNNTVLNQDYFQYELYKEYLDNINKHLFNSNKQGLSIKYFHIDIDKNYNYDETTGAQLSRNTNKSLLDNMLYDIYEFTPTMNNNVHTYQIETDEELGTNMETTGVMTIYSIVEPLPGDLFHYYTNNSDTEIFKVTGINYNRTLHDKDNIKDGSVGLKMYEIQYASSHISYITLNRRIQESSDFINHDHLFFINEFDFYFDKKDFSKYNFIIKNRDNIMKELNCIYNQLDCIYNIDSMDSIKSLELLINGYKILKIDGKLTIQQEYDYKKNIEKLEYIQVSNFKLNNTIKFLSKEISAFQSKVMPYFQIKYNAFKLIDRIEIKEEYLKVKDIEVLTKIKELYDSYYPFLHKRIIELDHKIW